MAEPRLVGPVPGQARSWRAPGLASRGRRSSAWCRAGSSAGWTGCSGRFFGLFNAGFRLATGGYTRTSSAGCSGSSLRRPGRLRRAALPDLDRFKKTPTGFIPSQDMGYLLVNVQLPDSASLERTQAVMDQMRADRRDTPGRQAHPGDDRPVAPAQRQRLELRLDVLSSSTRSTKRQRPEGPVRRGDHQASCGERSTSRSPSAMITVLGPPPVRGVGRAGGFKLMVEDRGDNSLSDAPGADRATWSTRPEQARPGRIADALVGRPERSDEARADRS